MKKRDRTKGNGEGSIFQLADGTWRGFITAGFDADGKQVKKWRRGKTRRIVSEKLKQLATESGSLLLPPTEKMQLYQWLSRYAALRASEVKPSTRDNHQYYMSKIILQLGDMPLHKIKPHYISIFYAGLADAGLSTSVRKHLHHFLKGALSAAFKERYIERNPMDIIAIPKGEQSRDPVVWNIHEVSKFLSVNEGARLYSLFYVLIALGPRIGEMLALKWSDILDDKIYIQRTLSKDKGKHKEGTPKTKRSYRTIYLSQDVRSVLVRRRDEQLMERSVAPYWKDKNLVFSTSVGTHMSPSNVRRAFNKLIANANVPKIRVHDLRHTYITLARDAGLDVEVVADRVGQDVMVTTSIYSKVTESRKRKAAIGLEELLNERHLLGTYAGSNTDDSDLLKLN